MTNQRMKWDAEAAFKRIEAQDRSASVWYPEARHVPYTPPSNIGPERLAQLRKYEPPAKSKGRDYDAILRAAKKAPVGYYEDAPTGIKFGGQPLPSASTKPHGKGVDTADGPWPKCAYASAEKNRWHSGEIVAVYEDADDGGTCYFDNGHVQCCSQSYERNISSGGFVPIALANAIPKLEQNGHADAAAQLRGKAINWELYT